VDAVVERLAADRWSLTLAIGPAQQRVHAASCDQLARAAALFVALVMDPSRADLARGVSSDTGDAGPPAPSPPAVSPRAAPPAPTGAPVNSPAQFEGRSGRRDVSLLVAAGLLIDAGTLPRPELLAALEGGIRYARVEITLQGAVGTVQEKTIDAAAGARLWPASVTITPCYVPIVVGRLRFGPCAQGEVGWIHAQGIGVSQSRSADSAWLSLGAELAAWFGLGRHFEARVGVGVLAPAVRPNFELTGLGSVFQPGVAVRGGTAAVVRF
jgi:hypothetical protein